MEQLAASGLQLVATVRMTESIQLSMRFPRNGIIPSAACLQSGRGEMMTRRSNALIAGLCFIAFRRATLEASSSVRTIEK